MSKFLDSEILNYTIKNLVSQIDKTFLKKKVLFNVTPAYYRLFDSTTDNPSDKLTVIANGLTPTPGQVTSDTVRFITKNPTVYAVGAEVVFVEEVMTPKFDNVIGLTEQELDDIKALTPTDRADKYFSNILFVVDDTKLVFYDKVLDSFTDCTSGEKTIPQWEADHDYIVGDVVQESGNIYESIKDHTSTIFVDDKDNWIKIIDDYVVLTQEQQDYLIENNLIEDKLYVVTDVSDEGSSSGGGSGSLTQDIIANIDVGNTKSGFVFTTGMTFDDYVKAVHVAYVNPKATFTFSNTNTLIEIGTSFDLTMNVSNIIKGTSDIDKVVFLDGNIELNSKIYNSSTSNYSHSVNGVNTNKTFKIRVYDNKNKYAEGTKTYTFVNPSYIGIVDTNSVDESIVTSLGKILSNTKDYTYDNITMTNKRICYAYPKSLGDLISVKDANNFEVLGSFIKTDLTINGINYVAYVTNSTSSLNNGKLTFK